MILYDAAKCLSVASHALSACDFTSREGLDTTMRELATELVVSYRNFMLLCRLAITGVQVNKKSNIDCIVHTWLLYMYRGACQNYKSSCTL